MQLPGNGLPDSLYLWGFSFWGQNLLQSPQFIHSLATDLSFLTITILWTKVFKTSYELIISPLIALFLHNNSFLSNLIWQASKTSLIKTFSLVLTI